MLSWPEGVAMAEVVHVDTLEFDLAESIWSNAEAKEAKQRAITYYRMACEKDAGGIRSTNVS